MTNDHTHDCTGPDLRCPCGYVMHVPPVGCSFDVSRDGTTLISDGFNCDDISTVVSALRQWACDLEAL